MTVLNGVSLLFDAFLLLLLTYGVGRAAGRRLSEKAVVGSRFAGGLETAIMGAALTAGVGWWAGILGVFNLPFAIAWSSLGLYGMLWGARSRSRQPPLGAVRAWIGNGGWADLVIAGFFYLPILNSVSTPFLDGDSFNSWNTWAQHWGRRSDLSGYLFSGYGQWLPVIYGYLYKLRGSATQLLPNEQFFLHGVHPLLGLAGLLLLRRISSRLFQGRSFLGAAFGLLAALLTLLQADFFDSFASGRVEVILFLHVALLALLWIEQMKSSRPFSRAQALRIGIVLGGFAFIKATGLIWSVFYLILFGIIELRRNAGFRRVLLAALLMVLMVAPFYSQQKGWWGHTGFTHPNNHSPGKSIVDGLVNISQSFRATEASRSTQAQGAAFREFSNWHLKFYRPWGTWWSNSLVTEKHALLAVMKGFLPWVFIGALAGIDFAVALMLVAASLLICFHYTYYGTYNFIVALPMVLTLWLVGLRYVLSLVPKAFDRTLCYWPRLIGVGILAGCAALAPPLITRELKFFADFKFKPLFLFSSPEQRLIAFFPQYADTYRLIQKIEGNDESPGRWDDEIRMALVWPYPRWIPHSTLLQWIFETHNYYPEIRKRYLRDELTVVSDSRIPFSVQRGKLWFHIADRLFRKLEFSDLGKGPGEVLVRGTWKDCGGVSPGRKAGLSRSHWEVAQGEACQVIAQKAFAREDASQINADPGLIMLRSAKVPLRTFILDPS